jgi:hypothetical protein
VRIRDAATWTTFVDDIDYEKKYNPVSGTGDAVVVATAAEQAAAMALLRQSGKTR